MQATPPDAARAASIASSTVSPAMKRRAKLSGDAHAVRRRKALERGIAATARKTALWHPAHINDVVSSFESGDASRWSSAAGVVAQDVAIADADRVRGQRR